MPRTSTAIRELLMPGETILRHMRPHWIILLRPTLYGLGLTVGYGLIAAAVEGIAPSHGWNWFDFTVLMIYLVFLSRWCLAGWVDWATTHYLFTNERIVTRSGWLRISGEAIALNRIHTVSFEKTLLERMLGSGSLTIESAAENDIRIRHVTDVENVQRELYAQINEAESPSAKLEGEDGDAPIDFNKPNH